MIARGKSVATMSMVMFKTCNLRFQIVRGRTISRATGTTNRLLTDTIKGGDVSGVRLTPHTTPDAMAGVPVPPRNVEMMLVRLQVEQQQQLGDVAAAVLLRRRYQRKERSVRQCWLRPWIERRSFYGSCTNLTQELVMESQGDFTNYMSVEPRMFHELLLRLTPRLTTMWDFSVRLYNHGLV